MEKIVKIGNRLRFRQATVERYGLYHGSGIHS